MNMTLTRENESPAIEIDNVGSAALTEKVYQTSNLNLWYGENHALKNINLDMHQNEVTAIIGPSGCGKSTYIKTLNRMIELVPDVKTTGQIKYRNRNILDQSYKVEDLRTQVGMVFQKPNPFLNPFMKMLYMDQRSMELKIKKFLIRLSKRV